MQAFGSKRNSDVCHFLVVLTVGPLAIAGTGSETGSKTCWKGLNWRRIGVLGRCGACHPFRLGDWQGDPGIVPGSIGSNWIMSGTRERYGFRLRLLPADGSAGLVTDPRAPIRNDSTSRSVAAAAPPRGGTVPPVTRGDEARNRNRFLAAAGGDGPRGQAVAAKDDRQVASAGPIWTDGGHRVNHTGTVFRFAHRAPAETLSTLGIQMYRNAIATALVVGTRLQTRAQDGAFGWTGTGKVVAPTAHRASDVAAAPPYATRGAPESLPGKPDSWDTGENFCHDRGRLLMKEIAPQIDSSAMIERCDSFALNRPVSKTTASRFLRTTIHSMTTVMGDRERIWKIRSAQSAREK